MENEGIVQVLDTHDIQLLEKAALDEKLRVKEEELLKLKINNTELVRDVKHLQAIVTSKDVELLKRDEQELLRNNNMKRQDHGKWVDHLKDRYKITAERWGYDPISGEITTE